MKVLQICHKPPFPPVDGGCIAMNNITRGLIHRGTTVKVLAANTFKHPLNIDALPKGYVKQTNIETVFIDTRIKIADAFVNLFSGESYNVKRFYSKDFEKKIIEILQNENYNIVHLESLFVTPYLNAIRNNSNAKIILRAHNIEFEIWREMAAQERNFFKKKYLKILSERMKKYELNLLNKYDGIAAISEDDAKKFREYGCKIPMQTIPLGITVSEYEISNFIPKPFGTEISNLFHLASMDWLPNVEGLEWFISNVWKLVKEKNPGLKLLAAGRNMPQKFSDMKIQNVEISGEVPDAKKFIKENDIMIVPLLNGSGVRVKIIEAMAFGKVVVATSVAAKGINCEHKKNILIADTPDDFSEMISLAVSQPELRNTISGNARRFVAENFDNNIITDKLISFYSEMKSQISNHRLN